MSPAKTCSEIFTASLHLIEVLAATTTASARCAGLGPSSSPILRPVRGLDSRVRLSRGSLLRGPRARVRKVVRSSASEVTSADFSATRRGLQVQGRLLGRSHPVHILPTKGNGDLARELLEDPRARVGRSRRLQEAELDQGVNFPWRSSGLRLLGRAPDFAQRSAAAAVAAAARTPTVVAAAASVIVLVVGPRVGEGVTS